MASHFELGSLRGKITSAYAALVLGAVVLGIISFSGLLFLERQMMEGEVVADLKDAVLEMRREEKNLFLYGDAGALTRADELAQVSLDTLGKRRATLATIMKGSDPQALATTLKRYREGMARWQAASPDEQGAIQEALRALGHQIYLAAKSLADQERRMLEAAARESRWFLFISLLLIGLSIYLVGRLLMRVVVNPLQDLESHLMPIAKGQFTHLEPPSSDREFVTFTDAFNRMLKELEIRQKRMLQSDKLASLGILASGVAHELNNPLSNISSSCQLLIEELEGGDPAQLNVWLRQIDSETERGRNIVRTLLEFGRQRLFQKQPLELLALVNETQIIISKLLQQYQARLTINIPEGLVVNADKQRMQQLFINLIQNALNAGGEGVHLRISAVLCDRNSSLMPPDAEVAGNLECAGDHEGPVVEILIADDGPGIPGTALSRVFDPFYTTSEPGKGVGLGLYIVQEIVGEHGGCLGIASKAGRGTQVTVLLPGEAMPNS